MIKHILKIIWHQRRNNGWIFVELLLVFAVLCIMMDSLSLSEISDNNNYPNQNIIPT